MKCMCCGKPLSSDNNSHWHKSCIKRFFNTDRLPQIDISNESVEFLARENTNMGYTVPGVQKKLSLHLFSDDNPRFTLVNYPTGYILKPQISEFITLPESEQLVMCMAEACGIKTVPHALIQANEQIAYITRRVDRIFSKDGSVEMLAMEDFCQLDLRLTQDKYRGSYERCYKVIQRYSSMVKLDISELYLRLLFSFVVGNSDMHLKNFSLIETAPCSNIYILSPAYDLLPVNAIMPEDKEEFALTMNGKKMNIRKKDFYIYADACGVDRKAADKMIAMMLSLQQKFVKMIEHSLIDDKLKERFILLLDARLNILN